MIVKRIRTILVFQKKCLSKCRDRLQLTYEDFQGLNLWIASQVRDLWEIFVKKNLLEDTYDRGDPYISLLEGWISEACQIIASLWHRFQVFQVLNKFWFPALIQMKILVQNQHIINEVLSWITLNDKGKMYGMYYLLRWLHWWYDFT